MGLVIAHQGWQLLSILLNCWLSGVVENGHFKGFTRGRKKNKKVFDAVWPSAWRSGVGMFMSYGLIQASGIMYAQVGSAARVASYLLGLRLIRTVSSFSQAPFYSKLPVLARLCAEGNLAQQVHIAKRGMALSYWTYVLGFIALGLFASPLLTLIESNASFPAPLLWSLLGLGVFAERYGAMHLQLYSTTNHIIWHIVTAVSGTIFIVSSIILFPICDSLAFPLAIIAANIGFYSWYSAMHSYKYFHLTFVKYESLTSLMPAIILVLFICFKMLNS